MDRSRRPVHKRPVRPLPVPCLALGAVLGLALGTVLAGCSSPYRPGEDYGASGRMDAARRASAEAAEDWNGTPAGEGIPQDSKGKLFLEDYRDRQGDGFGPGPWGLP